MIPPYHNSKHLALFKKQNISVLKGKLKVGVKEGLKQSCISNLQQQVICDSKTVAYWMIKKKLFLYNYFLFQVAVSLTHFT